MEAWVLIPIVAIAASFAAGTYRSHLRHQNDVGSRVETQLQDMAERLEKLEATIEKRDVIQRLNALEAIVTDRRFELGREIDGLDR